MSSPDGHECDGEYICFVFVLSVLSPSVQGAADVPHAPAADQRGREWGGAKGGEKSILRRSERVDGAKRDWWWTKRE